MFLGGACQAALLDSGKGGPRPKACSLWRHRSDAQRGWRWVPGAKPFQVRTPLQDCFFCRREVMMITSYARVCKLIAAVSSAMIAATGYAGVMGASNGAAMQSAAIQPMVSVASAQTKGPFVSPTGGAANPKVYGKTYGEWSAAWWQWVGSLPSDMNPIADTTGDLCDVGQAGPVWFLAGTSGGLAERTCTIPAGKAIFYPLINQIWVDCPPPALDTQLSDAEIGWFMATFTVAGDYACELTSTLDTFYSPVLVGDDLPTPISLLRVPAVRTQSPAFRINLGTDSIFRSGCGPDVDLEGDYGRFFSEGHWVMLPPLQVGEHVLTLHGASCDPNTPFENGVTYHLTVVPGKK